MPLTAPRFDFTKTAIEAFPLPAAGRVDVYDARTPGLSLRISSSGHRTFNVHARPRGGRVERVKIGVYPAMSVEQARIEARAIGGAHARGVSHAEIERQKRSQKTFAELATAYFDDRTAEGRRRVADLRQVYERYLGKVPEERRRHGRARSKPAGAVDWSTWRSVKIAPDDVSRLRADLAQSCGRTTSNRVQQLLRAMLNFGAKHGYVDRDHAHRLIARIELFAQPARTRRLSADEVRRFFAELAADKNESFRDFLALLLLTGARRTNVLAMRWDELDLDARTWEIPAGKAKAGEAILIPLSSGALEVLRRRLTVRGEGVAWVFPADSRSGHAEAPKKPWTAFRKRAGIPDVRLHDVRRTLGSWMIDTGAPLAVLGRQLGHRDAKSTAIYARLDLEPVRIAVERAEAAMRATAAKPADAEVVRLPVKRRRGRK